MDSINTIWVIIHILMHITIIASHSRSLLTQQQQQMSSISKCQYLPVLTLHQLTNDELIDYYQKCFVDTTFRPGEITAATIIGKEHQFTIRQLKKLAEFFSQHKDKINDGSVHNLLHKQISNKAKVFLLMNQWLESPQRTLSEIIKKYEEVISYMNTDNPSISTINQDFIAHIARKITTQIHKLSGGQCMDLMLIFYKMPSKLQDQEFQQNVGKRLQMIIQQYVDDQLPSLSVAFNGVSFLIHKHILDSLNIEFTITIPDAVTGFHAQGMGFNENMLKVFKFGSKSKLAFINIFGHQFESLEYDHFGKYFPESVLHHEGLSIIAGGSSTLTGILDVQKMGFTKLGILNIEGTKIDKIINIPTTTWYINTYQTNVASRKELPQYRRPEALIIPHRH